MTADDVRVEIYRSFIEGARAPMAAEIAHRLEMTPEEVSAGLRQLHDDDVIVLIPGTDLIWLAHPFCALDAPFTVISQDRAWDAICIWDALGILSLLARDGTVSTRCPDCSEELVVAVDDGHITAPTDYVVHYEVPARRWYEDVGYT